MVETFVNFRPKELWPKRVLAIDDAAWQTERVLDRLEADGFVVARRRATTTATTWSTTPRRRRSNGSTKRCANWPCGATANSSASWSRKLTRFAVDETIRRSGSGAKSELAAARRRRSGLDRAGQRLDAAVRPWLAKPPGLEDVTQLERGRRRACCTDRRRFRDDADAPGSCNESSPGGGCRRLSPRRWARDRKTLAGEVLAAVDDAARRAVARAGPRDQLGAVRPRRRGLHLVRPGRTRRAAAKAGRC